MDEVDLYLPKCQLTSALRLDDALESMGINKVFRSGEADLSRISSAGPLSVDAVMHETFINVDEEGSEAASATGGLVFIGEGSGVRQFKANHPFLFLIRDNVNGMILFLGRIVNPTEAQAASDTGDVKRGELRDNRHAEPGARSADDSTRRQFYEKLAALGTITEPYQRAAFHSAIQEANEVVRDLSLSEELPITESNIVRSFILTQTGSRAMKAIGTVTTRNYVYCMSKDKKFSFLESLWLAMFAARGLAAEDCAAKLRRTLSRSLAASNGLARY